MGELVEKIVQFATWEDIQNEWVIAHEEYAGNKLNKGQKAPQGLASAMGVSVDPAYGDYDPYAMDHSQDYQFASVGNDLLNVGSGIENAYLSYGGPESPTDETEIKKRSEPKRNKSARPKSGRPGSARSKSRTKENTEALSGLSEKKEETTTADAVPKAKGLVGRRPPSARVRTNAK